MSATQSRSARARNRLSAIAVIGLAIALATVALPDSGPAQTEPDRRAATPSTPCEGEPPNPGDLGIAWGVAAGQLAFGPFGGSTWYGIEPFGQVLSGRIYSSLFVQLAGTPFADGRTDRITLPTFAGPGTAVPLAPGSSQCLTWIVNPEGTLEAVQGAFPGEVVFVLGTGPVARNSVEDGAQVIDLGGFVGQGVVALQLPATWSGGAGNGPGVLVGELRLFDRDIPLPDPFIPAGGQPVSVHSILGKRLATFGSREHSGAVLVPHPDPPPGYQWGIASQGGWAMHDPEDS